MGKKREFDITKVCKGEGRATSEMSASAKFI